jgi:putative chitinase
MNLSTNFKLSELTQSDYALRNGIQNIPSPTVMGNLKLLADGLEQVRLLLGVPLFITSGYRCPTLNRAIGGTSNSAHSLGYAADFKAPQFGNPDLIVETIKESGIKYDQLICEGTWVHISFDPNMRQETLRALFDHKGKPSYREFV